MAEANSTGTNLVADIESIVKHTYTIEAILHGVESLLEEKGDDSGLDDSDGHIWHSLQMVKMAKERVAEIYCGYCELKIRDRIEKLEGGAA